MTDDLLEQKARAQQFSISMFGHVAGGATSHFLGYLEREVKKKELEILATDKTDEEKAEELQKVTRIMAQNAHLLIRYHTANIVGGLTQDMFPDVYPKEETAPEVKTPDLEVVKDPIVIGVASIPSEERVMG